ncbi:MAG TPA: tetratricopeptide repeat protein [Kofleriaceae bacterium]|nr:tetratricopeptide repeat protein [Kofleriaceae bacterium]
MVDCLDEDAAVALIQGELATRSVGPIYAHVEDCDACRQLVATLARMPTIRRSAADVADVEDELASRIADRYELGAVLGAGAMGIVYQAHDTKLERTVALKRVRGRAAGAHDRLVREALVMAQLAHPSVVHVFDAGIDDGAAFVVMEYVAGDTLRAYLARVRPSWRAIGELFVQMARGLEAAHVANLVHGDFKPDNVLVDRHGRARVADFGLARTIGETPSSLAGTPAYMAPELLDGGAASAASDQYAWATSLYEALAGNRPHAGTSVSELRAMQQRPPAKLERVPSALARIVERGLASDPAARFPSMAAAAAALAALPRRRARRALGVAAAGVALASGAIAWTAKGDAATALECGDGADQLAEVWSADRAARIRHAFADHGAPGVGDAVVSTVDAYGERWRTARKAACEATRSGEQSPELLDRRMSCLDLRRESLRQVLVIVDGLAPDQTAKAMPAVLGLPAIDACADRSTLLGQPALPERARGELQALQAELERGHAEANAGRFDAARVRYDAVVAGATKLEWSPLVAEAWMSIGHLELERGHSKQGDDALANAIDAASRAKDDRLMADTLIKMLAAVTLTTVQTGEAERMIKLADAAVTRAGNDPGQRAELHYAAGTMLYLRNDRDAAAKHFDHALAIWEALPGDHRDALARLRLARASAHLDEGRFPEAMLELAKARAVIGEPLDQAQNGDTYLNVSCMAQMFGGQFEQAHTDCVKAQELFERRYGPDHPDTAAAEGNFGNVLLREGKGTEALAHLEHAYATTLAAFGPEHPQTLLGRKNLANALAELGQHQRARDHFAAILAAREHTQGKDHPKTIETLTLLAGEEMATGDRDLAIAHLEQALPQLEKLYGPNHEMTVTAINGLAMAYQGAKRSPEALVMFERAKRLLVERAGPDDLNVGVITFNIAEIVRESGHPADALARYAEIERIWTKALPPTHALFGHLFTARGEALLALHRGREAIASLERALPIRLASGDEAAIAQTELALAESLLQSAGSRDRARSLVESASKRIDLAGPAGEQWRRRAARLRSQAR